MIKMKHDERFYMMDDGYRIVIEDITIYVPYAIVKIGKGRGSFINAA